MIAKSTSVPTRPTSRRERKDRAHFPPGADARIQIVNRGAAGIGAVARFQKAADQAGESPEGKARRRRATSAWDREALAASGRSDPAQAADGFARAFQKCLFFFAGFHLNGFAEGEQAEHRDGKKLALGQNAIHIFQIGGNQFHVRAPESQVIESGAEFADFFARAAGAFRKKNQGIRFAQSAGQIFNEGAADELLLLPEISLGT